MTAVLNEFGGILCLVISLYLVYRFGRLLHHYGNRWVLAGFAWSVLLIMSSTAIQRGWAGFTRHLSPPEDPYNAFMDEWRWLANLLAALAFFVGAYMFEHEMMEIKNRRKQRITYAGLFAVAGIISWL